MKRILEKTAVFAALTAALALATGCAQASIAWNWSYAGAGIHASGLLSTSDTSDPDGFYEVLSISGSRNGVAISGLFPTGQAIPGNEPFTLDNLIRSTGPSQLTVHGLGFALADGSYANPFYADFLSPAIHLEVLTKGKSLLSELPIAFIATRLPTAVPEPASLVLVASGLLAAGWSRRSKARRSA